jgi:hypothetical protein
VTEDIATSETASPADHRRKRKPKPKLYERIAGKAATSQPKTVAAIIKTAEAATPPPLQGMAEHQWPPQRGPPRPSNPLPSFIKFRDLEAAGIVGNHCALRILIEQHGFPKGCWFGAMTHVWRLDEVEAWLAARPSEQPKRLPSDKEGSR